MKSTNSFAPTKFNWAQTQIDGINKIISEIPEEIQKKFAATYEAWEDFCNQPGMMISSNSRDRAKGEAYENLVKMGKADPSKILPLLVQKLMDRKNFFAVHIYEAITGKYSDCISPQSEAEKHAAKWLETNISK